MILLVLVLGLVLAAIGGDRFVRGSVGLASWLGIPAGIVGATVAAFATSSPELTVGVLSAVDGQSQLAFGDATGSNMVNLGVVFGFTLLLGAVSVQWSDVRREVLSFVAALLILVACSVDGEIGRVEALGITLVFLGWLTWVVRDARSQRSDVGLIGDVDRRAILLDVIFGLILLVVAGRLIVLGGKELGELLGWSPFVVGTVVVAIGTSAPELVTTVIAARRGHVEVGVGTILGSNIFNSLFIVGIAGAIDPIRFDTTSAFVALVAALVAVAVLMPGARGGLGRRRGVVLVGLYAAFLVIIALSQ